MNESEADLVEDLKADADELAHALYTVLLHARVGSKQLIEDRIRGAAMKVPWFADRYQEIEDLLDV